MAIKQREEEKERDNVPLWVTELVCDLTDTAKQIQTGIATPGDFERCSLV